MFDFGVVRILTIFCVGFIGVLVLLRMDAKEMTDLENYFFHLWSDRDPATARVMKAELLADREFCKDYLERRDDHNHSVATAKVRALYRLAFPENEVRRGSCGVGTIGGPDGTSEEIVFPDGPVVLYEPGDHLGPADESKKNPFASGSGDGSWTLAEYSGSKGKS